MYQKKALSILVLFMTSLLTTHAAMAENDSLQASWKSKFEGLYSQQQYQDALSLYQANRSIPYSKVDHYHLGLLYSQLNDWAKATYHFQIASLMDPNDSSFRRNLNQARIQLQSSLGVSQLEPSASWITELEKRLPFSVWIQLFGWSLFLWMGFLIFLFHQSKNLRLTLKSVTSLALCGLCLGLGALCLLIYPHSTKIPLVVKEKGISFSGPGISYLKIQNLYPAMLVYASTKSVDNQTKKIWYRIDLKEGRQGWIPENLVTPVKKTGIREEKG